MVALALSGCRSASRGAEGKSMMQQSTTHDSPMQTPTVVCVGRLRITIPGPASVNFFEQEIDDVKIQLYTPEPDETLDQAWNEFVRDSSESRGFSGGRSAIIARPVVARRPGLIQRLADSPGSNISLDVWFPRGKQILKLSVRAPASDQSQLKSAMLDILPEIDLRDGLQPVPSDFCISGGVIHQRPQFGEAIKASIVFDGDRYQVDISTVVQKQAYPPDLLDRFDREVLPAQRGLGLHPVVLLREKKQWNESDAEAIVTSTMIADHGKRPAPDQFAQLSVSGIANDAQHPALDLKLSTYFPPPAHPRSDTDFLRLWKAVQDGLLPEGGSKHGKPVRGRNKCTPRNGREIEKLQDKHFPHDVLAKIPVRREAIPIIFVPGLLASRVYRIDGGKPAMGWDPDSTLTLTKKYLDAKPRERLEMMVGPQFSRNYLHVAGGRLSPADLNNEWVKSTYNTLVGE